MLYVRELQVGGMMKMDKSKILFSIQWSVFYMLAVWWLFFGCYFIYDVWSYSSFRFWGAESLNHWSTQGFGFYALDMSSMAVMLFSLVVSAYILRKTYYLYALMFLLVPFVVLFV